MNSLGKKLKYMKNQLKSGANDIKSKTVLERVNAVVKEYVPERVILAKDRMADRFIQTGMDLQVALMDPEKGMTGFFSDQKAEMKAPIAGLLGGIILLKFATILLPQTSSEWSYATNNASGAMYGASASDKATWNAGGSFIPFVGLAIVAGIVLRSLGH